ncbi:MAG: universal stress protein [Bacteroidales bacterium]|nr:universal stress protein [Bacteroidales bacterium]MBN2757110.1 universal stress protein [Bacteroidales bacterium]
MENRYVTIATLKKQDANLLKKQLDTENINYNFSDAEAVRAGEESGIRIKINEKDRKKAIHILEEFSKTYGLTELDDDIFPKEIDRILVPVDFSENSKNACQYAIGLAEKLQSEIMLMHSYYFPVINSIDYGEGLSYVVNLNDTITEISEKAKENLIDLYENLKKQIEDENIQNVKLNFTLANGNPANEIIEIYNSYHPDLIIMGTKGKTAEKSDHFGSVSANTINETKVPVLAIPEVSKYQGIKRINILFTTNFDEADYKAIKKLMTLVYSFDVKLNFIHIGKIDSESTKKIEDLKDFFNNLYPGYEIECNIIECEKTLESLQNFINDKRIDIIAMTTHRRNFISRIFYPSMTKKMLFQTDTPLLVFHA